VCVCARGVLMCIRVCFQMRVSVCVQYVHVYESLRVIGLFDGNRHTRQAILCMLVNSVARVCLCKFIYA